MFVSIYIYREAQKLELRVLPSDISSIVGEVIELMSFSIFQKGIEFVTYVEPCVDILCDGNRMKQVLACVKGNQSGNTYLTLDFTEPPYKRP